MLHLGVLLCKLLLLSLFLFLTGFSLRPGFGCKRLAEVNQAGEGSDVLRMLKELSECFGPIPPAGIPKTTNPSKCLAYLPFVIEGFTDHQSNADTGTEVCSSHN